MHQFKNVTSTELRELQDVVRTRLAKADSFEEAAQLFTGIVRDAFKDTAALVRLFVTSRYDSLIEEFRALARKAAPVDPLLPSTLVLTLLGTSGARPEWQSRRTSIGHKTIPLVNRRFVDAIPMVARLLAELDLPIDVSDPVPFGSRILGGGWYGVFFVNDATETKDSEGRYIIPDQTFVAEQKLRSVWGIGVAFPNETVATLVAFTREELSRPHVESLVPLMRTFKVATAGLVAAGRMMQSNEIIS